MLATRQSDFIQGAKYLLQGFKVYTHPHIKPYIYVPLLINFIIFGVLFYLGIHYLNHKLSILTVSSWPSWLQWIGGILSFIKGFIITSLLVLFLGISAVLATICANVAAAPFNGLLSESYAKVLGETLPSRPLLQTVGASLLREGQKFLYYLPRGLLVGAISVILYFIPPFNLLTPILLYWFAAWMMAIQYIDYPADNEHVKFALLIKAFKTNKALCLGFGLAVCAISSIPFINFFVLPAAVLGATKLWVEKLKREH
ncbi:sulfate transporter CysZ [Candidatus Berkiella aquae]|uniref:Putative sulfate transport protein CysZ n=1 Tax=Candidatus Berkiella aquae TaxID=295108 RepID=A0A0Q9YLR0_9GAMM|nr:sulfate transporter CysZ [Candidatus Berkiella aquae]MCS5711514.1 sulfate transporter CysZ [Candidatus Berkiella aquae]